MNIILHLDIIIHFVHVYLSLFGQYDEVISWYIMNTFFFISRTKWVDCFEYSIQCFYCKISMLGKIL